MKFINNGYSKYKILIRRVVFCFCNKTAALYHVNNYDAITKGIIIPQPLSLHVSIFNYVLMPLPLHYAQGSMPPQYCTTLYSRTHYYAHSLSSNLINTSQDVETTQFARHSSHFDCNKCDLRVLWNSYWQDHISILTNVYLCK